MTTLRTTLLKPAIWLSSQLDFALKYWTLGLGIALVGAYLSSPLFHQIHSTIALATLQGSGVKILTRHNQLLIQLVNLRAELATRESPAYAQESTDIKTAIAGMVRDAKSTEEIKLSKLLERTWTHISTIGTEESLDQRFAAFNAATRTLHALSRETARNYRLNLDPDLDAAFDIIASHLPAVIDSTSKQDQVIEWGIASMAGFVTSEQMKLDEASSTLKAGVNQVLAQRNVRGLSQSVQVERPKESSSANDGSSGFMDENLQKLLSGLQQQQDAVDQVNTTTGAESVAAKRTLHGIAQSNLRLAQLLLEESTRAAYVIIDQRIAGLEIDRIRLIGTLFASGFLITYLLYAFYIGVIKSINALSRGTNAFCAGQRDVRIELQSRDELSLIATNFNTMAQEVERMVKMIEEQNQTRERDLKVLVNALGQKNEELYTVNQRVNEELNLARSVQLAILPQQFPNEPTWSVHACMHPARELGGDFYDCFALPDGRHGVLVADVSGKGVGAAFFMAVSRTVLLDSALSVRTPSQVLALANDLLCARNPMDLFVTACYGIFDPQTGSFEYASAGHHPPMVRRLSGEIDTLPTTHDMALGALYDMQYQQHRTQLEPGDTLLMYTDGVTEAFSPQEIAYGEARLSSWLSQNNEPGDAAALVDGLVRDVARFVDGAEASDDLTCLVLCHKRPLTLDAASFA